MPRRERGIVESQLCHDPWTKVFDDDICAGDVLTSTSHVASYEETKGSLGEMLITTTKTVYKNQDGKTVAISTGTGIRY